MSLWLLEDFEQDGEESESDPDVLNDPVNQIDLQVRRVLLKLSFVSADVYLQMGATSATPLLSSGS